MLRCGLTHTLTCRNRPRPGDGECTYYDVSVLKCVARLCCEVYQGHADGSIVNGYAR